jgi:hypothetical protein
MTPANLTSTLSLVMRRSGVRFSEAAPVSWGSEQPDGENFSNHVSDVCENLHQPLVSDGARTRLWASMNTGTEQDTPVFTGTRDQSSTVRSGSEPLAVPSGATEWPTDPSVSYMEGPLDRRAAAGVEKDLARIPDLLARYPLSNPDRLASIHRFEQQYAEQTVHSVLQAPEQATMWAWVSEAFAREARAELETRRLARLIAPSG